MKLDILGVDDWPVRHEPVGVHHRQVEASETYYVVEGEAEIRAAGEEPVRVSGGDLLTILPGTACVWHITKEIELHCSNG